MNKAEKTTEIGRIEEKFKKASIAVLTEYSGLNAEEMKQLRRELKNNGDELVVAKNRLVRLAIDKKTHQSLSEFMKGPTAIVFGAAGNPVSGPKILVKYSEEHAKLIIKKAFLDGKVIETKDIVALSSLPSKEELLGKFVGSIAAPASGLVRTLNGVVQKLVTVIKAVQDQKASNG
ncbi:MAG: 50S ribosomal protein L10 [Deltaproteobacteria bacterium RIFCSPLOWO2_02_FULL_50_16]|nr:MAG: 50S ribosomal protein L10 [Deltaproteobacteria bacterium GWA2_50_8]OGQ25901.1 MAG: 50S ribosomal protein L10 [Deltaproteobacteria bacterium RIFCSPHIGHO2_02_FULL_50_15]OGQ55945.1 MAG: 50S ribosomal protein L10 [Deltaproteobacteria bacterium RIFCSPLOWO2_02_FULL_50_16]OGQ65640.1 MAG: 50S ribosomal protein L10 [Deltaproteobacteria bacterium RIFCSPLOWO2_12_FULL_50_11]